MTIIVTGGAGFFIGSGFVFHMLKCIRITALYILIVLTYAGNLSTLEPVMHNSD